MPISSKARHGDPVVSLRKDPSNTPMGVPTSQFQEFLDEIEESISSIEAAIVSLSPQRVETSDDYTQLRDDKEIFSSATLEVFLFDPDEAIYTVTYRSIVGTMTLTPTAGTTEATTVTVATSVTMAPRDGGWFIV